MIEIKQDEKLFNLLKDDENNPFRFSKGSKLFLEVEVTDDLLSGWLTYFLYHPESIKGSEFLGFITS